MSCTSVMAAKATRSQNNKGCSGIKSINVIAVQIMAAKVGLSRQMQMDVDKFSGVGSLKTNIPFFMWMNQQIMMARFRFARQYLIVFKK